MILGVAESSTRALARTLASTHGEVVGIKGIIAETKQKNHKAGVNLFNLIRRLVGTIQGDDNSHRTREGRRRKIRGCYLNFIEV